MLDDLRQLVECLACAAPRRPELAEDALDADALGEELASVHMVQHLLLAMVAPPLLALGAPITLVLRIASPRARHGLILPVLHSRAVRLIASPLVAWPVFAIVMWLTHFSPLLVQKPNPGAAPEVELSLRSTA